MHSTAYNYLNKDKLLHADMLLTLNMNEGDILYAAPDGVLVYNRPGCVYMLSMSDEACLSEVLPLMSDAELVVLHQPQFKAPFIQELGLRLDMECFQYVYLNSTPPSIPAPPGVELKTIEPAEAAFVFQHYSHASNFEYIQYCIEQGMIGAYKDSQLMGFIGCHGEGSMGLLEVLPQYRRQGLALCLGAALMAKLLQQGRTPYSQVVVGNEASIALQKRSGMQPADTTVCWLCRD